MEFKLGEIELKKRDPKRAAELLKAIDAIEAIYSSRIIPIDARVAAEWARLLGSKEKNQRDRAIAATARVHGFIVVTRNIIDSTGRDVDVLNPFEAAPRIIHL
jgi:predicted nucleic acid-binding protein